MRSTQVVFLLLGAGFVIATGCGGATESDLFNSSTSPATGTTTDGGTAGNTGGTSGSTAGSTSGATAGTNGGTGGTATAGTTGGNTGGTATAGTNGGNGGTANNGGNGGTDAGPIITTGIDCGSENGKARLCSLSSQTCCATLPIATTGGGNGGNNGNGGSGGTPPTPSYACVSGAGGNTQDCASGIPISCDSEADCTNGDTCCGLRDQNDQYVQVLCEAACDPTQVSTLVVFCDPNAATDICQQYGMSCVASQVLVGFNVCH